MKRLSIILSFFLLLVGTLQAQAVYTVDNIPKVHLQDRTRYVCDPTSILSVAARDTIDHTLYALEQQTGIETVVAVVPSIGEEDCFDFSHQLLNKWGVGQKGKDNGLVILLVIDQRCVQFYTGYGLEGDLPDAVCKRIQTRDMLPFLKKGDWSSAMTVGIKAVYDRLNGSMTNEGSSDDEEEAWFVTLLIMGFILIFLFTAYLSMRASTKCPNCGKHTLQRSNSRIISNINGIKTEDVTYTCTACRHTVNRIKKSYDNNYRGGGGGGPVIFGGGFGGGSFGGGGGFGGGSFGGGRGGGGGAGTRF
jgi:uncharacterized protein